MGYTIEVKREILSRDISLFKEYVQPAFEDYLKDAFIELMSREIRGVSIYEILDYRVNQRGVLELVNLVGDNKELFHAIPQFFRDWFREYGWTKIPTFKFDFLMAMQNAGRIQICKLEPAYHVVWYLNKGLRQGFKLEQIVEIKRILDDCYKNNIATEYMQHEKTSLLKFLTELVNLGINSRKMLQRREFYEVPFDEADIYEIFYRQLLLFMYDDKCREEEIKSCFNENPTIDDENDTGSNNDQPIFRFREPEVAILKKNELARKLFCHYLAERLDNKDTDRFRQCFTYFSLTIQKDVDDIYDYAFQTFTTIVITKHRIQNVQIITDSGNAEKFKLIRDWSEVLLAGVVQVVPYSEKKKFYELYKELLKRTENSLGGVFKINSKPDSLMFAILKSLSGESDSIITNNPSRSRQNTYAVGVNIALQKIVIALETYQSTLCKTIQSKKAEEDKSLGYWALKKCDVYVASFGKILIHERLELVRELWAHNIKTDFMYEEPEDLTPEILASSCKNQGINWIVILKQKNQDNYKATSFRDAITTVKVKNLLWKTEDEEIQEQMRIDHQTSGSKYHKHNSISINESTLHEFSNTNLSISPETSNQQSNFNINIVGVSTPSKPSKKMKLKQKQLLRDKAHDNVSNFLSNINNGNIPVISIDVSRDLLRKFIDCNVLEDESFKSKILDIVPAHQKEYIITVQDALKKQRYQENSNQVWLYSHRDDFGLLYQYFS
ncbi:15178_t:CDS:10 [Entrophospora sp. SA101]|nr:15178_t:CDS:10 [Entrophospora sp. SA101]